MLKIDYQIDYRGLQSSIGHYGLSKRRVKTQLIFTNDFTIQFLSFVNEIPHNETLNFLAVAATLRCKRNN